MTNVEQLLLTGFFFFNCGVAATAAKSFASEITLWELTGAADHK